MVMNYEILNMTLAMVAGVLAAWSLFVALNKRKKDKIRCSRCNSKKVNKIFGEETYYCSKCGYQFGEQKPMPIKQEQRQIPEAPNPPEHICRYCEKSFPSESKLRRHIGMSHFDKIDI